MSRTRQLCTFELGDLYLAVHLDQVQEVLKDQPVTRVPLAPASVRGLINLRGQIVAAVDPRELLGMPPRPARQEPMNVVLRGEGRGISLTVDEIGDVLELPEDAFGPPPESLDGVMRELVLSVCKLERRLLVVLDAVRTANLCVAGQASE